MKIIASFLLVSICFGANAAAQTFSHDVDNAWEPGEGRPSGSAHKSFSTVSVITGFADNLIKVYQTDISRNSISRCPFKISCSNFAREAISRYGLVGFLMFIDRYYYRENMQSFSLYPLVDVGEGTLKLDDSFYMQ